MDPFSWDPLPLHKERVMFRRTQPRSGSGRFLTVVCVTLASAAAPGLADLLACTRMCAATYKQGRKDCYLAWMLEPTQVDLTQCLAEEKESFCSCLSDCFAAESPPIPFPAWRPHIRADNFSANGYLRTIEPRAVAYTLTADVNEDVAGHPAATVELAMIHMNAGVPEEIVLGSDTNMSDGIAITFDPRTTPIEDDVGVVLSIVYYDAEGVVLRGDAAGALTPTPGTAGLLGLSFLTLQRRRRRRALA